MTHYSQRHVMKSLRPAQTAKALTLVEMLMVVVIAGLIATMAIPMVGSQSGFQLEVAARRIVADLRYTQNQAMQQRQTKALVFDPAQGFYFYPSAADPGQPATDPISKKDYLILFSEGCDDPTLLARSHAAEFPSVELDSADFSGDTTLYFDYLGFPVDVNGTAVSVATIGIRVGSSSRTITVNSTNGEVTIN